MVLELEKGLELFFSKNLKQAITHPLVLSAPLLLRFKEHL
jgi:hypothetical protein